VNRREAICGVVAVICLFPLLVIFFIPAAQVEGIVRRSFARQGYTFTSGRFGTAFPYGIIAGDVTIADSRGPLLRLDRLTLHPAFLPLMTGNLALSADALVGAGTITVQWRSGQKGGISADISGLPLDQVPFFRTVVDATVAGRLWGEARLSGVPPRMSGVIKIRITGGGCSGLKIGELPLPAVSDETIQGMLRVKDGRGRVESLTFEGNSLYARLSGDIPLSVSAPLDLSLELMPKADFLEKQKLVFLLLVRYLDSPGHYRLPVRGTLAKPSVF